MGQSYFVILSNENTNRRIYKDGSLYNGELYFSVVSWDTNYRVPSTGSIQCVDGIFPETSAGGSFRVGGGYSYHVDLASIGLDIVYNPNTPDNDTFLTPSYDPYTATVNLDKDIFVYGGVALIGGFDASISIGLTGDVPEDVPIILSINGEDQPAQYFSTGSCSLSYSGDAIFWAVRIGNNGNVIAEGMLDSATVAKNYNITGSKIQRNTDDFLISEINAVKTIQNQSSADIVKAEIITL